MHVCFLDFCISFRISCLCFLPIFLLEYSVFSYWPRKAFLHSGYLYAMCVEKKFFMIAFWLAWTSVIYFGACNWATLYLDSERQICTQLTLGIHWLSKALLFTLKRNLPQLTPGPLPFSPSISACRSSVVLTMLSWSFLNLYTIPISLPYKPKSMVSFAWWTLFTKISLVYPPSQTHTAPLRHT